MGYQIFHLITDNNDQNMYPEKKKKNDRMVNKRKIPVQFMKFLLETVEMSKDNKSIISYYLPPVKVESISFPPQQHIC